MGDIDFGTMPARHWCSCGRGFYSQTGQVCHSGSCAFDRTRAAAFMAAVRDGRDPFDDPVVAAVLPRLPVGLSCRRCRATLSRRRPLI